METVLDEAGAGSDAMVVMSFATIVVDQPGSDAGFPRMVVQYFPHVPYYRAITIQDIKQP